MSVIYSKRKALIIVLVIEFRMYFNFVVKIVADWFSLFVSYQFWDLGFS